MFLSMLLFLFQSVLTVERDTWIIIIIINNTHYNLLLFYPWQIINIVLNCS
jgi:hypothetical protein